MSNSVYSCGGCGKEADTPGWCDECGGRPLQRVLQEEVKKKPGGEQDKRFIRIEDLTGYVLA